jgi:hypothetical protein
MIRRSGWTCLVFNLHEEEIIVDNKTKRGAQDRARINLDEE